MSAKKPLVSLIIPCHNLGNYLNNCLESVREQSIIKRCEVLCIDDGSTDDTYKLLESQKRSFKLSNITFRILNFRKNRGAGFVRNKGLHKAFGETIMFLDGDDMFVQIDKKGNTRFYPYYLEHFYDTLKSNTDTAMVVGQINRINDKNEVKKDNRYDRLSAELLKNASDYNISRSLLYTTERISSCGILYRTNIINQNNNVLEFNPKLTYFEDMDFVTRYVLRAADLHFEHIINSATKDDVYGYVNRKGSATYDKRDSKNSGDLKLRSVRDFVTVHSSLLPSMVQHFGEDNPDVSTVTHKFTRKLVDDVDAYSKKFPELSEDFERQITRIQVPDDCIDHKKCDKKLCGECACFKTLLNGCIASQKKYSY